MKIILLLILISVAIAVVFLLVFYWSMKSGQYDDTYTPSVRMLFDDPKQVTEGPPTDEKSLSNQPANRPKHHP
jgi:cbb3-type cytochrome oxidase maturation protein